MDIKEFPLFVGHHALRWLVSWSMNYSNQPQAAQQCVGAGLILKRDIPQIPEAHSRLDKEIDSVNGLLNELRDRLRPALRLEAAQEGAEKCPTAPANTIVERLNESGRLVCMARDKVQDILRLLEL